MAEIGFYHLTRTSLLAALPNAIRHGIDYLPEVVASARARHPEIFFEVSDVVAPARARDIEPIADARLWDAVICDRLCHSVFEDAEEDRYKCISFYVTHASFLEEDVSFVE